MFLSGENRSSELSNKTDKKVIYPPLKSHLNVSFLLSFSVAHNHSVWIDKNCNAYSSKGYQIDIRNENGQQCRFVSAVCGAHYTLYLAYGPNKNSNFQLIYEPSYKEYHFLDIGNRNPQALFGGYKKSAAIDSEGAILIIKSVEALIEPTFLPNKDKAINIACCDSYYFALGSSGRVYKYIISESAKPTFTQVDELKDEKIVDISGTTEHAFFVTNKGKVFGYGSNVFKRQGIESGETNFKLIHTLEKYRIVSAFAGFDHSLFITSEGDSLACGYNDYAQTLPFDEPQREKVCPPLKVPYEGKAKFFVLGYGITVAFIDCQIPPNMPNKIIEKSKPTMKENSVKPRMKMPEVKVTEVNNDTKDKELELAQQEIKKLLQTQEELKQKIKKLEKKVQQQQKEIEKSSKNKSKTDSKLNLLTISDIEQFETMKKLGHGSIADVFEVTKQEHYVMKVFELQYCKNDENEEEEEEQIDIKKMRKFMKEYEILNQIDDPNIIKTYGFFFGDKTHPPTIILEYCPTNLKKKIKKLTDDERITIIFEICLAMKKIQSLGIIHRNLKLENILLDENNHVKISDFGQAALISISDSITLTQMTGTLKYMAPELINGNTDNNNMKVDVYSFGVILYLILNKGEFPKIGFVDVGNGKKAEIPSSFTSFSKNLINKCWSFDPKDRPSFSEIYEALKENKNNLI